MFVCFNLKRNIIVFNRKAFKFTSEIFLSKFFNLRPGNFKLNYPISSFYTKVLNHFRCWLLLNGKNSVKLNNKWFELNTKLKCKKFHFCLVLTFTTQLFFFRSLSAFIYDEYWYYEWCLSGNIIFLKPI